MKTPLLSLMFCPLALTAQEIRIESHPVPKSAAPQEVRVEAHGDHVEVTADRMIAAPIALTTDGSAKLSDVLKSVKEQVGELNLIMQGDVGDIVVPEFSVKDASAQSLLLLLGNLSGFEVESAPPQVPGQLGIVVIRRVPKVMDPLQQAIAGGGFGGGRFEAELPPGSPPEAASLAAGGARIKVPKPASVTDEVALVQSFPLPGVRSEKTMKVVSLGVFSDSDSWDRNVQGLKSLLLKTLITPGKDEKLPDDALRFDKDSRLLIIRLEPEKAAEASKLVEGYVQSLKERQAAAEPRVTDLRRKQMDVRTALDAAASVGKQDEANRLEEQLMRLRAEIAGIEHEHGLR